MSVSCSLLVTCLERADLLALLHVMFSCIFVTFPYGVLGQVWYLIVSIPDLCLPSYLYYYAFLRMRAMPDVQTHPTLISCDGSCTIRLTEESTLAYLSEVGTFKQK